MDAPGVRAEKQPFTAARLELPAIGRDLERAARRNQDRHIVGLGQGDLVAHGPHRAEAQDTGPDGGGRDVHLPPFLGEEERVRALEHQRMVLKLLAFLIVVGNGPQFRHPTRPSRPSSRAPSEPHPVPRPYAAT